MNQDNVDIVSDFIKFCNQRSAYHKRKAQNLIKYEPDSKFISNHIDYSDAHKSIAEWFTNFKNNPISLNDDEGDLFSINPLDLEGLDEDVRDELSLSESDILDAQLIQLLNIAGRPLDLNEIIIGSFRKFKTKYKRPQLTARIHKLISKGLIEVEGKGVYKLSGDNLEDNIE